MGKKKWVDFGPSQHKILGHTSKKLAEGNFIYYFSNNFVTQHLFISVLDC